MTIKSMILTIQIPWAQSLKDKRMVVKSAVARISDRFNVSIAEVDHQDVIKTAVIAVVCVAAGAGQVDSILDEIFCYLENHTEAELSDVIYEYH